MQNAWKISNFIDLLLVLGLMLLLAQVFRSVLQVENLVPWVVASLMSLLAYIIKRRF